MKKITGSLPFRLLLGVILGIIVGQLADYDAQDNAQKQPKR